MVRASVKTAEPRTALSAGTDTALLRCRVPRGRLLDGDLRLPTRSFLWVQNLAPKLRVPFAPCGIEMASVIAEFLPELIGARTGQDILRGIDKASWIMAPSGRLAPRTRMALPT
jgi:hypothetical protein